jgi:hypothetical protein
LEHHNQEITMLAKYLLASLAIAALATPAFSNQFYIVQDTATRQCAIAERPPANGAGIVVGDGAYGDRNSAEGDMKTIHVCISQAAASGTRIQDTASPPPLR